MDLIFIITSYFDLLLLVVEGTLTEIMKINFLCKCLNTTGLIYEYHELNQTMVQ